MDAAIASRMTAHITSLARANGVKLRWVARWQLAEAIPDTKLALVPRIKQPSDYFFGLHELGHILDPTARELTEAGGARAEIICESAAWAWAADAAEPALARHLRARDWNTVAYGWRTYLRGSALH